MNELKETKQALEKAEAKLAGSKTDDILKQAVLVGDIKVAVARLDGTAPDELRKMTDTIKANNDDVIIMLAAQNGEKITFTAACGKKAISLGAHAGNLVREVAKVTGGNGGGKPDSAMAGGKDASKIDEALAQTAEFVKAQIGG
jgi:alanyl-tRNA synthetase